MKWILILFLLLSGCATQTYKEYNAKGQLIKDYKRTGVIPWSSDKQISFEAHGV